MNRSRHWQMIYTTRQPTEVGWYERDPMLSRRLVEKAIERGAESVVDVGGGGSFLVDHLLELGLKRVAVVDISEAGLGVAKERLGARASSVEWIVGDVAAIEEMGRFDVWHDRAAFHFLVDPVARQRYVALSEHTVEVGGTAVIATFAPDGPERCSGLPVRRYDRDSLAAECGPGWQMADVENHLHTTPLGVEQRFLYSTFRRVLPASDWATSAAAVQRLEGIDANFTEVEYVGGPRDGEHERLTETPPDLPSADGAYRRSVRCADDGALRYVWYQR